MYLTLPHQKGGFLFNAYDLQVNPLEVDKIKSQEVVNYCKSRFQVALQVMMGRSKQDQEWMSEILFHGMVFFIMICELQLKYDT